VSETVEKTGTGAILYDPTVLNHIEDASFSSAAWQHSSGIEGRLRSAGRGATSVVSDGRRTFVIRHYHRGGLVARATNDAYLWLGENRTRSFKEFRLLSALTAKGLPVPRPAAARYRRRGAFLYTADLITEYAPGIRPLSVRISDDTGRDFWRRLGAGISRFHDAGVNHADLNAYNVQVDGNDETFILDFDRGRLMTQDRGSWRERNLARLRRSLEKVRRLDTGARFSMTDWQALCEGYRDAARSA
jgi:3-deoxy-D-manno-octulosonic acid kinase